MKTIIMALVVAVVLTLAIGTVASADPPTDMPASPCQHHESHTGHRGHGPLGKDAPCLIIE